MVTNTIGPVSQQKSLPESIKDISYSALSRTSSTIQTLWANTPQLIKTPLETIYAHSPEVKSRLEAAYANSPEVMSHLKTTADSIQNLPPAPRAICKAATAVLAGTAGPVVQGAVILGLAASEIPKEPKEIVLNDTPFKLGEERYVFSQVISSPSDTLTPQQRLNKSFRGIQKNIEKIKATSKGQSANTAEAKALQTPEQLEQITNKNLQILTEKISAFSTLYGLHSYICQIQEPNYYDSLLSLAAQASKPTSNGKKPSLWKLFYKKYKNQLSYPQIIKAALFYFLCNYIPIIPNTVDAYMKNFLFQLRLKLKKDSSSRNEFIQKTVINNTKLLSVSNAATKKFAKEEPCPGPSGQPMQGLFLIDYQEEALKQLLGIPEEELSSQFMNALVDQYPTHIPFKFGGKILNWMIPRILKKWILPKVSVLISEKETKEWANFKTPFLLAITKNLIEQMEKLQEKLDPNKKDNPTNLSTQPSSEPLNFIGNVHLSGLITNLLEAIHLSGPANTIPSIKEIQARVKKQNEEKLDPDDAKIKAGIEEGFLEGAHLLLNHLADPNNTEDMFATLIESFNDSFSREIPKTDKEIGDEITKYEASKQELKEMSSEIFKTIIESSVNKAAGDIPPEETEAVTKNVFIKRKEDGISSFAKLEQTIDQITTKISASQSGWSKENSIQTDLVQMADTTEIFKDLQKIDKDMKELSNADKESIQRVLIPICENAKTITDQIDILQDLDLKYALNSRNAIALQEINSHSIQILTLLTKDNSYTRNQQIITLIHSIRTRLTNLQKDNNLSQTTIDELFSRFADISELANHLTQNQDAIKNLQEIHGLSEELILQSSRNNVKKPLVETLKNKIALITSDEQRKALLNSMENIRKRNRKGPSLDSLKTTLFAQLQDLETTEQQKQTDLLNQLNSKLTHTQPIFDQHQKTLTTQESLDWNAVSIQANELKDLISKVHQTIQNSQKELLLQIPSSSVKRIAGQLGSAFGMLFGFASSSLIFPWITVPMAAVGLQKMGTHLATQKVDKRIAEIKHKAQNQLNEIFEKGYENILTSGFFLTANLKMLKKEMVMNARSKQK